MTHNEEYYMADPRFGKKIKELRREKNITLRQLARDLGLTPAYVSRIENGHENPPKAEYISKIAQILGVDESVLFALVPKDLRYQRIPDDIIEGYQKNEANTKKIPEFFRTVKDTDLTEDDWDEIIETVKKKGKEPQ